MKKMNYIIFAFVVFIALWTAWGFFGSRVEQADYTVVKKMEGYEIRYYPERIVAETTITGTPGKSRVNALLSSLKQPFCVSL